MPLAFFFLHSNFLHKLPPPRFLLGIMAKELIGTSLSWCLVPFNKRIFSRGSIIPLETKAEPAFLSLSLIFRDLVSLVAALSSASIRSSREDLWFMILLLGKVRAVLVVVVTEVVFVSAEEEMTCSNRDASLGEANAFNCFPRFRIVSWHSANFSEAAVISRSCKIDQVLDLD